MSIKRFSDKEQASFREWLEVYGRDRSLGRIQIYEHIDLKNGNRHLPVTIDEAGGLYVADDLVLISKKQIPVTRHNISWGLSHTPFRQLYGLPKPYSRFTYDNAPLTVQDLADAFSRDVTQERFQIAYWLSYVLYQRQVLRRYIAKNGRRLKWIGAYADPDFRKRKSLFLFPRGK